MQKINVALVCAVAFTLTAAAESYTYTPGATSLGNGAVTITYDGETTNIKTLTANTAGDTISISGDPITFADGATITLASSGTVSFAQKVTTLGATTLARGDGAYTVWTGSPLTENTVATSVFGGLGRDAYVDSSIVVVGDDGPCPGRFTYVAGPSAGIYTLNMVRPDYTYSIRAQLSQSDGVINAVRCVTGSRSPLFAEYPTTDLWGNKSCVHYCTDTAASDSKVTKIGNTSALKLRKIIIRKKGMAETVWVRFDGGATLGGTTSIGVGVEAVLAASKGSDAAMLDYPITGDGDFRIVTRTSATGASAYFEPFITTTSWQVLAENCSLSALSSLSGRMLGASHNYADYTSVGGTPCDAYWIKYDPVTDTATCQFQWGKSDYDNVKVVKASLKQNGANVEIKATSAGYKPKSSNPLGSDFSNVTLSGNVATSASTSGYGIHMITATFAGVANIGIAQLNSTMNTMFGSMLTFDGSNGPLYVTVTNKNAFPVCGVVNVGTNADVSLRVTDLTLTTGISGGTSKIAVQQGGALRRLGNYNGQIGLNQDVVVDGGTYETSGYNVYQRFLTLMNGAHTTGDSPPRTVYAYAQQNWKVRGSSPSFIDNGINIFGSDNASDGASLRFRFDVANVTGDDDIDCTVAKIVHNDSPNYRYSYFRFEKLGAGTMLLNGTALAVKLETYVSGGTFLLGASGIVTNEFVLCGGNLAAVAGAQNNNIGALSVSSACTITVGEGGSLAFASFAPDAGLARKSITIDAPITGDVLKFNSKLSGAQLAKFCWKDPVNEGKYLGVGQDANGYLHPTGFVIFIR